jgi:hypothetical protein
MFIGVVLFINGPSPAATEQHDLPALQPYQGPSVHGTLRLNVLHPSVAQQNAAHAAALDVKEGSSEAAK